MDGQAKTKIEMRILMRYFFTSLFLLCLVIFASCGIYPALLWCIGQSAFSFQANGSILQTDDGKIVGSKLIAQEFTTEQYFHPRPSAVAYNAAASGSSALAVSNYALRDRVARFLGPIARLDNGDLVAPEIETWFKQDRYNGKPGIIEQWTKLYPDVAKEWHGDVPATFFDLWRQEHPDIKLQLVPGDMVTASASGLDPHITLQNALWQLPRVAAAIAGKLKTDQQEISKEIENILQANACAPLGGLAGDRFINVLQVNLELHNKY